MSKHAHIVGYTLSRPGTARLAKVLLGGAKHLRDWTALEPHGTTREPRLNIMVLPRRSKHLQRCAQYGNHAEPPRNHSIFKEVFSESSTQPAARTPIYITK